MKRRVAFAPVSRADQPLTLTPRAMMPLAIAAILLAAAPAAARPVPGGEIGTLEIGRYVCELAGDATGPVGFHVPEADFSITNASSYRIDGVGGSYLRTADRIVLTSGPRKGERYRRISTGFLRKTEADGRDGPLRCVLTSRRHG